MVRLRFAYGGDQDPRPPLLSEALMGKTPPAAFLVVCEPGTSEVEASVIRAGMRAFRGVAAVSPVTSADEHEIAEARANAQVRAEVTPICDELRNRMLGVLDEATEEFARVTEPGTASPSNLPAQRSGAGANPNPQGASPPSNLGPRPGSQHRSGSPSASSRARP